MLHSSAPPAAPRISGAKAVHYETAAERIRCHAEDMQLQHMKVLFATVWVILVIAIMVGTGHVTSMSDRLTLGLLAVLPPLAMWFWWNDPARTMSESIHEVRDLGPSATKRAAND